MTFVWPPMLWLLAFLPMLAVAYVLAWRRQRRAAARYAALGVAATPGRGTSWRAHLAPVLMLVGIAALIVAAARPRAVVTLPTQHKTIMLAIDVSLSMRANDVEPDRLTAAQRAAKEFVAEVPDDVRVGIVVFGESAMLAQRPTASRRELADAIDRFELQYGTATGAGLIVSLATLFPDEPFDADTVAQRPRPKPLLAAHGGIVPLKLADADVPGARKPVPPGSYGSAVIILLSDGRRTSGPDPLDVARIAADHGVRVYTVGFGTREGGKIDGFEGFSQYVKLDEETLRAVADITHGEYSHAGNATDLREVYRGLNARLVLETQETEVSALVSALGALLVVCAVAWSLLWHRRPV